MSGNCDKPHLKIFEFLGKKNSLKNSRSPLSIIHGVANLKFLLGGRLSLGQIGERVTGWNNLTNFVFQ